MTPPEADLEKGAIPWRTPPSLAGIEVLIENGVVSWRVEPGLAADAVEVVLRDLEDKLWVRRDVRLEGVHELTPKMDLVGVRGVRGDRIGVLFAPRVNEDLQQALVPGPPWQGPRPETVARFVHALDGGRHSPSTLDSGDDATWGVLSLEVMMRPEAPGLSGDVRMRLAAPGGIDEVSIHHMPGEAIDLAISPEADDAILEGRTLSVTFFEAPEQGEEVNISFAFDLETLTDLGVAPVDSASQPDRFFFGSRGPLIPAPDGMLGAAMPLTLELDLPESWRVASNLMPGGGGDGIRLEGGLPVRGRPAVASGAYEQATRPFGPTLVEALALPGEDGVGSLEDYVESFTASMNVFEQWGALTQEIVSVAAVTPEHGGSAHYGLVLVPDFIFHRDRTRARDFFLAHELSHQWWGAVVWPASALDLWLTEGLADYAALRALEVLHGESDAGEVWRENLELLIHLMAEGYGDQPGRDVPVRPTRAADLQDYVYYLKGSWVLRHLEALVGRNALDDALAAYYGAAIHATASTDDFIAAVEAEAGRDLSWFWRQWLSGTGLPEVVHTVYVDPDDPDDFEVVVSQIGDRPFADEPWRLPVYVRVGERAGWVCLHDRQQGVQAGDLRTEGPLGLCDP